MSSISSSRCSSSFEGELTRVEIGQRVMRSDGNGCNRSRGPNAPRHAHGRFQGAKKGLDPGRASQRRDREAAAHRFGAEARPSLIGVTQVRRNSGSLERWSSWRDAAERQTREHACQVLFDKQVGARSRPPRLALEFGDPLIQPFVPPMADCWVRIPSCRAIKLRLGGVSIEGKCDCGFSTANVMEREIAGKSECPTLRRKLGSMPNGMVRLLAN